MPLLQQRFIAVITRIRMEIKAQHLALQAKTFVQKDTKCKNKMQ